MKLNHFQKGGNLYILEDTFCRNKENLSKCNGELICQHCRIEIKER